MIFQFEAQHLYQIDAVAAAVDSFDGQPLQQPECSVVYQLGESGLFAGQVHICGLLNGDGGDHAQLHVPPCISTQMPWQRPDQGPRSDRRVLQALWKDELFQAVYRPRAVRSRSIPRELFLAN